MSSQNIFCIVGLGNPGSQYEKTRHNAGFLFLDYMASAHNLVWEQKKSYHLIKTNLFNHTVIFLKPMQYMNLSGFALQEISAYYHIPISNILVCYDDLAFKIGDYRLKPQGSAGGHNGLGSMIEQMGTSHISRLRLGIGKSQVSGNILKDFVLSRFSSEELKVLEDVFKQGDKIVQSFIEKGLDKTMSIVNFK